jgi:hypothetical protein
MQIGEGNGAERDAKQTTHGGFKVVDANGQTLAYVNGLRYPADLV